jgi:hypothetical protein
MCPHRSIYGHMNMSSTTRDDTYLEVCLLQGASYNQAVH